MSAILPPGEANDIDEAWRMYGPEAVKEYVEQQRAGHDDGHRDEVPETTPDPFNWLEDFELTDAEAEAISDPDWVFEGLIPEAHVFVVIAKANGGKTTIFFDLACHLDKGRFEVVYVHADTNPAEAKTMRARAKASGVRYLTPDMKVGLSMKDVVDRLRKLAGSDADLSGHVWILDTLKKCTAVINKASSADFMQLARKLTSRGMTLVLLGHANKHPGPDGFPVFEGTGDIESDADELIYLIPHKNPDDSLTVSSVCEPSDGHGKKRAPITEHTWDIAPDRTVTRRTEYVDVKAQIDAERQREEDNPVIEAITEALEKEQTKQVEVVSHCKAYGFGERRVVKVLRRYSGDLWKAERLMQKNAWRYELRA